MANVYFLRHGQTSMNNAMVLQGRSDLPLNEKGMAQAATVGEWFREQGIQFDYIYTSPLKRAIQTAQEVSLDTSFCIDNRLIEMDYGPYEGADLKTPPPELLSFLKDLIHSPAPTGMETLENVVARLGDFLEDLRGKNPSGNILISTHAIAMKGALEYLTPESKGSYWAKNIGNCAVYQTVLKGGIYTIPIQIYKE